MKNHTKPKTSYSKRVSTEVIDEIQLQSQKRQTQTRKNNQKDRYSKTP